MRRQRIGLDLTLIFDDGASLRCHGVVLAAASVFFRSFLVTSSLSAAVNNNKVRVENSSKAVFQKLLDYAYTGKIEIKRDELAALTDAASAFGFKQVQSICHLAAEKFRYRDGRKNAVEQQAQPKEQQQRKLNPKSKLE